VDDTTALILEEIGRIGVKLSDEEVTVTTTPEEVCYFWKRIREGTASLYSGIHYGHYKAAARSSRLSSFLAKKITLISRTGCSPDRWSYGLTVMLEMIAGIAPVNKLRAILLMEADFNFHNKYILEGECLIRRAPMVSFQQSNTARNRVRPRMVPTTRSSSQISPVRKGRG